MGNEENIHIMNVGYKMVNIIILKSSEKNKSILKNHWRIIKVF